jgi:hypothetical protein
MNLSLRLGSGLVVLALAAYSTATFQQVRLHLVTDGVRRFLWLGVGLDLTATACMIRGSSRGWMTFHGMLGYSALFLMVLDAFWITAYQLRQGSGTRIPERLQSFSIAAYFWWVLAFLAGIVLAVGRYG